SRSLRLLALFLGLFVLYLIAVYARPPLLHLAVGLLASAAGIAGLVLSALAYPTPEWGAAGTAASFLLSALTVGTVTTAMLLGHWYLVVPNLSTRPLYLLLGVLAAGLLGQAALAALALLRLAGRP